MRQLLPLSVLLFMVISSCGDSNLQSRNEEMFLSISKEIKSNYAPDRRDKTYEVTLKKVGENLVVYGSTTEKEAKEALIKKLSESNINVLDSITILPDQRLGDKIYGVVNFSVANLRYGADYSSEMATQLLMGTPVRILEKKSYWYRVLTPENYIAWVTESSIHRMNEAEYNLWKDSDRLIITSYYTLFREKISENSQVVSDGVWGDIVQKIGQTLSLYLVKLPDGREAYIPKRDATPLNKWLGTRELTPDTIVNTAKGFLGFPYLWAGTSIKGMDCSGFTKTTYLLNGVILKRDASQQAKTGIEVDITDGIKNLKMGDLLFFGKKATKERAARVSHVGIYIEDGWFIHSASYVHINNLLPDSDKYYSGTLVSARRIIGQQDKEQGIASLANHPWYFNK